MTDDLVRQYRPLIEELALEAVASTPEHWRSALLTVRSELRQSGSSLSFSLESPDGHRDHPEPNDELYDVVKKLFDHWVTAGHAWASMRLSVALAPDDSITYTIDFTY